MTRNANPTTHGEALHEGGDGFGELEHLGVHAVFVGPECLAIGKIALGAGLVKLGNVAARAEGFFAFRIDDGSSGFYYGWMSVTLNDDGNSGTINGWAWENSGASIQVGQIPEPSAFLLGALGTLLLLRRRR